MATIDDIDPAQAGRRVNEQLFAAVSRLDEHIQALTAPTMELALAQRKRIADTGLEELDQSVLMRKFVSQAGPGAMVGAHEPGQLNTDASSATRGALPIGTGPQWNEMFGASGGQPGAPSQWAREQSAIAGKTNVEAQRLEEEPIRIPSFGDWRLDAVLKLASQVSGKKALSNYEKYASEAGEEAIPAQQWLEKQGPLAAGNVSGTLAKASQAAVVGSIAKTYLSPLMDIGFGASNAGASLGYSPQGEGLGGGFLGASHYFGIPNPLAAITSPAGRQGLGTVVNAAEAAIGGSGIGIGEANSLRQALAAQGWSNQRSGGMLGLTVGGEQENLALALEGPMKKGFKNPEVLAEFTSSLKLGTGSVKELKEGIEDLAETAKQTHHTWEQETVKAQEFMAKAVEGGSTMIHGLNAYREIAHATGMSGTIIQGINEGQFGQVQALSKGIMPWEIQGMSGNAASLNAYETVRKVAGYVPKQTDTRTLNKVTGKYEVTETAAEKEGAYIHMLEPSITAEEAKRLKEIGPKLEAVQGGFGEANTIQQHRYAMEQANEQSKDGASLIKARNEWSATQTRVNELKDKLSKMPSGDLFSSQEAKYGDVRGELEEEEEKLRSRHSTYTNAMAKAAKAGKLSTSQQGLLRGELEGPKGLYATASAAGVSPEELAKIKKEGITHQAGDIYKALEKLNKVSIEKQNEENAKIELSGPAKAFFKLKFPAAAAKAESNEGGAPISNKAASPNAAGETASEQSLMRQAEQAQRAEHVIPGQ